MPFCLATELRGIEISRLRMQRSKEKISKQNISFLIILFFRKYYLININITCNKGQEKLNCVHYSQVKFCETYPHHQLFFSYKVQCFYMTQDAYLFELYLHLNRVNKGSNNMHYNSEDAWFGGGILRGGKWVK